jgi:hypothetical protein
MREQRRADEPGRSGEGKLGDGGRASRARFGPVSRFAAGGHVRDPGSEPTPARTAARVAAPAGGASQARSNEPRLSGVPLGSLASCVSDRDEDALKQQLVAIVWKPSECVSEAGRYRFVETRNLNSFLLWVERAPSRRRPRCFVRA